MEGGTTFHFVTDGIETALGQASEAAGGKDVMLWAAQVVRQYPAAGLLDELELHFVPVLLGDGLPSSTTSGTRRSSSSRSGSSRRAASPTSSTGA
jgi:dihydrofolate reductase